jgi:hypothetical protein
MLRVADALNTRCDTEIEAAREEAKAMVLSDCV